MKVVGMLSMKNESQGWTLNKLQAAGCLKKREWQERCNFRLHVCVRQLELNIFNPVLTEPPSNCRQWHVRSVKVISGDSRRFDPLDAQTHGLILCTWQVRLSIWWKTHCDTFSSVHTHERITRITDRLSRKGYLLHEERVTCVSLGHLVWVHCFFDRQVVNRQTQSRGEDTIKCFSRMLSLPRKAD